MMNLWIIPLVIVVLVLKAITAKVLETLEEYFH